MENKDQEREEKILLTALGLVLLKHDKKYTQMHRILREAAIIVDSKKLSLDFDEIFGEI